MKVACQRERAAKDFKTEAIGNFQVLERDIENKGEIVRQLKIGRKS